MYFTNAQKFLKVLKLMPQLCNTSRRKVFDAKEKANIAILLIEFAEFIANNKFLL